ncbi:MAG: DUF779 domain-containing protein [Solirubrobacterales bacterium]
MPRIEATPAAVETIGRLREKHGPIVLHQSGGCCAGSAPMCLAADELPAGAGDIELGRVAGVPFLIDADLHRRLGSPDFLLDVMPGREDTFSLEGSDGLHFTTRMRPVPPADPSA